jgi:hypothetical protein
VGFGLALGASYYDPWYYDYPAYYSYTTYYGDAYAPAPYDDRRDDDRSQSAQTAEPAAASSTAPAACGSWAWNVATDRYDWKPC